jgi:hypothetical protein
MRLLQLLVVFVFAFGVLPLIACDTGFGEPCSLPKTERFRTACSPVSSEGDQDEGGVEMLSKASCAVKNYAGCATRICLVYQGSSPFCSTPCTADTDCESKKCRPIIGDQELEPTICQDEGSGFTPECYCVRAIDVAG